MWVKLTVNRRLAKSHGYYLQHAKEVCLVGQRGGDGGALQYNRDMAFRKDVICSERRGQSQKPEEIYEMIENLVPNGTHRSVVKACTLPDTCMHEKTWWSRNAIPRRSLLGDLCS